jgi:coiled-coil domain-containing protein 12
MKVVDVWTENAIARLVRERIEGAKRAQMEKARGGGTNVGADGEGEEVGMEGATLVEAMHVREREEEEERGREREDDLDVS